jgi:hypothetical protein
MLNKAPAIAIIAEMDPDIRPIVAEKHGFSINNFEWQKNRYGTPTKYLKNVWECVDNLAATIHEALVIRPGLTKIVLIGGSPCQDLTLMSYIRGFLGVTGSRSRHFHIFQYCYVS